MNQQTSHWNLSVLTCAVLMLATAGCGSGDSEPGSLGACPSLTSDLADEGCNAVDPDPDPGANLDPEGRAPQPVGACRWLTGDLPGGSCSAVDPWGSMATWQSGQEPLDTAVLNFVVGGNAVDIAELHASLGFQPPGRADLPRWPLRLPLDWAADPFNDRNWQFHVNAWRMADPLIIAWKQTKSPGYIEDTMGLVADWHRFYITQGRSGPFGWNDMATGIRAMKLAWLTDQALRGNFVVSPAQADLLIELSERHARKLREKNFLSDGNHGLFQLHGLLALCNTLPYLKSCPGGVSYAETAMERLLGLQFTNEGVHREHSPEYHLFVANVLRTMLRSGWYDDFTFTRQLIPLIEENRAWMYHPDGKLVGVGDSIPGNSIQFPQGDSTCALPGGPGGHCYRLQAFPETGYAIVRSDWAVPVADASMLFLMAGFHSAAHKHADDLSFELFEFGERVLTDTGKYKYAVDAWRTFVTSPRAHNTLEVEGQPGAVLKANAYGSGLRETQAQPGGFALTAEASRPDTGRQHQRRIYYSPRRSLLIVDQLSGPAAPAVTQWFHFAPQVEVASGAAGTGLFLATLSNGWRIEIEPLRPGCTGELYRGATAPEQGWTTVSYGELVPRQALGFRCSGTQAAYVTLFVLDPAHREEARQNAEQVLQTLGL